MKTNQLILAAALVALAACNKENIDLPGQYSLDNEIGFTAVTRKASKATTDNGKIVVDANYPKTCAFKVWGWQSAAADFSEFDDNDESNFMSGLTIEWTKGATPETHEEAWRNADHYYYWPFTGKISFLAIHPSSLTPTSIGWHATNDKPQAAFADYTITPGTNETVDLMFATNADARRTSALPMVFKHALSQIEVQVKTDADYSADVAFDVESVTFHNVDLSGDVTYINDVIAWTDNTTQTQNWVYYNEVMEDITNVYQVYGAAKVNIPQPANIKAGELESTDENYVEGDLTETTITIGYSMEQTGSEKITGTVTVSKPQIWEAGKRYVYTLNFRLNEILFDPEVANWVDADVATINIY